MSFEIIRRKEGELSQKQEIRHSHTQFAINSYGHLSIREFNDAQKGYACELGGRNGGNGCVNEKAISEKGCIGLGCTHYKQVMMPGEEHLLVLDQKTTNGLIEFIFKNRSTYEFMELLKGIVKTELPF
jgi:hypothetical protein